MSDSTLLMDRSWQWQSPDMWMPLFPIRIKKKNLDLQGVHNVFWNMSKWHKETAPGSPWMKMIYKSLQVVSCSLNCLKDYVVYSAGMK